MTSPLTSTAALNLPNFSQVSSYLDLIQETQKALRQDTAYLKIEFLSDQEVFYKQNERKCAKETAIKNPYAKETEYKYLHANVVCKRWIATRAPIQQDLEKFWILAFTHNLIIVDLTNTSDKSLRYGGPINYVPQTTSEKLKIGDVQIQLEARNANHLITIDTYSVVFEGEVKVLNRIHFSYWQKCEAIGIEDLNELVDTIFSLKELINDSCRFEALIHSYAGNGRTGTLIAALEIKEAIIKNKINRHNYLSKIYQLIMEMRMDRNENMVENVRQFELLCNYAEYLLKSVKRP